MYVVILRFVKLPELALKIQSSRNIKNILLNAEKGELQMLFPIFKFCTRQ